MSSSHQNREKSSYRRVRKAWFLSLTGRLRSEIRTWNTQCIAYKWHNTSTVHVPILITAEFLFFIKLQFTTNAQNVPHLNKCRDGHVWSWTVTPLKRSRGGCEWLDIKNVLVMYLTFLTVAKYATVFQCPHTQKSLGVRSGERGGCTLKTKYGNILTWNFFLSFGVDNHSWSFSK
jgi:hypothetical protein